MKFLLMLLSIFLLFFSCQKNTSDSEKIKKLLRGSWTFGEEINHTFSFEDSLCSYGFPYNGFGQYYLKEDTIFVHNRYKELNDIKNPIAFKIIEYDSVFFLLKAVKNSEVFMKMWDFPHDTIHLKKIMPKNKIKPKLISFRSTPCYGHCPWMSLEIDENLNVLFYGRKYTKPEGCYSGKINEKEYQVLLEYLHNLPVNKIEKDYEAEITDQPSTYLCIKTENSEINTSSYGLSSEPIELVLLKYKISEVYKHIDLQKDSFVLERFKNQNILYYVREPPPPPPPDFK